MANFQETYVKIAEATAASRDALTGTVTPLGDSSDYNGAGLDSNVKTIVDIVSDPGGSFTEEAISEIQFEIDTLIPANSSWTQMRDLALSNSPYNAVVSALNDFVTTNVLGVATDNATSIDNLYQTTLQGFLDIDCVWDNDPSAGAGAPTTWINLMVANGYSVVDTNVDNG